MVLPGSSLHRGSGQAVADKSGDIVNSLWLETGTSAIDRQESADQLLGSWFLELLSCIRLYPSRHWVLQKLCGAHAGFKGHCEGYSHIFGKSCAWRLFYGRELSNRQLWNNIMVTVCMRGGAEMSVFQ